jgi:hypothetical protein
MAAPLPHEEESMEKFSASVAGRHMACHASANLDIAIPHWTPPVEDPDADTAANRGTIMHAWFAEFQGFAGSDRSNLIRALDYVDTVRSKRRFKSLVEVRVTAQWLDTKPSTTADLVLYVADEIHIFDLKTGRIPVPVVDNGQMLFYAATYGHLAPKANGVYLHIVQPWADNIDFWFADAVRIRTFMGEALAAEQQIQLGDTTFMPGDHCKFCPANPHSRGSKGKPLCPAMKQVLYPDPTNYDAILGELDD